MAFIAAFLLLIIFGIGALFPPGSRPPLNLSKALFIGAGLFLLTRLLLRAGLMAALLAGGLSLIFWILRSIRD